jgi:hypothetical protein
VLLPVLGLLCVAPLFLWLVLGLRDVEEDGGLSGSLRPKESNKSELEPGPLFLDLMALVRDLSVCWPEDLVDTLVVVVVVVVAASTMAMSASVVGAFVGDLTVARIN